MHLGEWNKNPGQRNKNSVTEFRHGTRIPSADGMEQEFRQLDANHISIRIEESFQFGKSGDELMP